MYLHIGMSCSPYGFPTVGHVSRVFGFRHGKSPIPEFRHGQVVVPKLVPCGFVTGYWFGDSVLFGDQFHFMSLLANPRRVDDTHKSRRQGDVTEMTHESTESG